MPWKTVLSMEQKQQFVSLAVNGRYTVTELCEEFGVSRKTGHKWLRRHGESGMEGLEDRSRAPKSVTRRTGDDVERLIVGERRLHRKRRIILTHLRDGVGMIDAAGAQELRELRGRQLGCFVVGRVFGYLPHRFRQVDLGIDVVDAAVAH